MIPNPLSRSLLLEACFVFLIIGQTLCLWWLPYSTSELDYFSDEDAPTQTPPTPNFQTGDIKWDVELYRAAPELEPFRRYFQEHCSNLLGIEAGVCLSDSFLKTIPFGMPESDFFDNDYSPAKALDQHLKGVSGHCVSYSGLTATALLSVGIPARVVQIIPREKKGHTVVELWDDHTGWVLFDSLNGGLISNGKKYLGGIEAVNSNHVLHRVRTDQRGDHKSYLKEYYEGDSPFDGQTVYPEPYFYTRVGEKQSLPIYRGRFAVFGGHFFFLGPAQNFLRGGIVICLLGLLTLSVRISLYQRKVLRSAVGDFFQRFF